MTSLQEMRERLKKQYSKEKESGEKQYKRTTPMFPFWNMEFDTTTTVRFLPDGNENNQNFWKEIIEIELPFAGIKGITRDTVKVKVPSMLMFQKKCQVKSEVSSWFNTEKDSLARKYWIKRSFLYQGFVRKTDLKEDDSSLENPIRLFRFNKELNDIILQYIMDDDVTTLPFDYEEGVDFRITKTKKGNYANYTASKFATKPSSLTEDEITAIENYGLYNLSDFTYSEPSRDEQQVIWNMFEDSIAGESYDPDKYEKYFVPLGYSKYKNDNKEKVETGTNEDEMEIKKPVNISSKKSVPKVEDDSDDDVEDNKTLSKKSENQSSDSGKRVNDILARLARSNSQK